MPNHSTGHGHDQRHADEPVSGEHQKHRRRGVSESSQDAGANYLNAIEYRIQGAYARQLGCQNQGRLIGAIVYVYEKSDER